MIRIVVPDQTLFVIVMVAIVLIAKLNLKNLLENEREKDKKWIKKKI